MKEIEVGSNILVVAKVEAFRTGLNSGPKVRVKIGDQSVWAKAENLLMLPRGSAKWVTITDEWRKKFIPEDGETEETDGNL